VRRIADDSGKAAIAKGMKGVTVEFVQAAIYEKPWVH